MKAQTVEDAIEFIGTGRVHSYVVIASGLCLMNLLLDTMGISYVIPAATCELELDTFKKGLLNSISFLGIVVTSHLWGFYADTMGRNRAIRISLTASIILTGISALVPNYWAIIVLRFLSGLSLSGASSTVYAYMGELLTNKMRSKLMVLFGSFVGISVLVITGVGWIIHIYQPQIWFSDNYIITPWRIQILVLLIPGIVGICIYFALPESPKFLVSIGDTDGAYAALKEIYERNYKGREFPVKSITAEPIHNHQSGEAAKGNLSKMFSSLLRETIVLFKPPYLVPVLCCCFIQYGIYTVASGLGMWYPEISNRLGGDMISGFCDIFTPSSANETAATVDNALATECVVVIKEKMFQDNLILGAGYLLTNTIIYALSFKLKLRHIVILMLAISSVAGFLLPNFSNEYAVVILFTVFLMCSGSCVTTINIVTVSIFPTYLRGMTLSMTIVFGRISILLGVNGMGFLLESNCAATIYAVASLVAAGSLVGLLLMPKKAISE